VTERSSRSQDQQTGAKNNLLIASIPVVITTHLEVRRKKKKLPGCLFVFFWLLPALSSLAADIFAPTVQN